MCVANNMSVCIDNKWSMWRDGGAPIRAPTHQQALDMSKRIHVVPHGSTWATRTEGASRVGGTHRTQEQASQAAREQALRSGGEVVIHRPNGQIRDSNTYGHDPFPPRG